MYIAHLQKNTAEKSTVSNHKDFVLLEHKSYADIATDIM